MNPVEKIFRIGLLLLGFGFLAVYAYQQVHDGKATHQPEDGRYAVTVGNTGSLHTVYLVDTREGTIFYAVSTAEVLVRNQPLEWKVSRPTESK